MMELDETINVKIKNSRIFGVSNPKTIKEILNIPNNINIKKLDKIIDTYYDVFYLKKTWAEIPKNKEERKKYFLNIEKVNSERFEFIPSGEDKTTFRKITVINQKWLKKTQKKFNKILMQVLLDKKIRGIKQKTIIPYLHSSVKQRSYSTNAQTHIGDKYVFAIDLKDFYPSVSRKKICRFFKEKFNLPYDIAMFYAVISTSKNDENNYRLGQGLSQSSTLAYLVNYSLFNYLYYEALGLSIDMSIYVDDVVFSSKNPIPQTFINRLFNIIKNNDMSIKKQKVINYKNNSTKKITGVYITGNKTRVSNKKHEELHCQYKYLKENIILIRTMNDYYKIYNLYLKFYGNYQHIKMVEVKVHDRYTSFLKQYDCFFPKGINKNQKNINYRKGNIKNESDIQKINSCYQKLINTNKIGKQRFLISNDI